MLTILPILQAIENEYERRTVEDIFNRYFPKMTARAFDILNSREDAEDAAMNVIQRIASRPAEFLEYEGEHILPRLMLITQNEAIDIYRRKSNDKKYIVSVDSIEEKATSTEFNEVENLAVSTENQRLMQEAIYELKDKYRIPLLLCYGCQMNNTDIAEYMGIDRSRVDILLFRARKEIKKRMIAGGYKK